MFSLENSFSNKINTQWIIQWLFTARRGNTSLRTRWTSDSEGKGERLISCVTLTFFFLSKCTNRPKWNKWSQVLKDTKVIKVSELKYNTRFKIQTQKQIKNQNSKSDKNQNKIAKSNQKYNRNEKQKLITKIKKTKPKR